MYTLQWERHYRKIDGKRRLVRTLAYTDEQGIIQGEMSLKLTKDRMLRQWVRDNEKLKIEDLPKSKELREKLTTFVRDLKRRGYIQRKVIYGTVKGNGGYRRIEVYSRNPIPRQDRSRIHHYFGTNPPQSTLTIILYQHGKFDAYYFHDKEA